MTSTTLSRILGAAALLFLLTAIFWPSPPPTEEEERSAGVVEEEEAGSSRPRYDGAVLSFLLQCEVPPTTHGPTVRFEISTPPGAARPFHFTTEPLRTRQSVRHRVALPETEVDFPLTMDLVSEHFCISPGLDRVSIPDRVETRTIALVVRTRGTLGVFDEATGDPLADAVIRHHGGVELSRTAADGTAEVSVREKQRVRLMIELDGWSTGGVELTGDAPFDREVFLRSVREAAVVAVDVFDWRGSPVEGALIDWEWESSAPLAGAEGRAEAALEVAVAGSELLVIASQRGRTDAAGRWEIPAPRSGTLRLWATHPKYGRTGEIEVVVPSGTDGGTALPVQLRFPEVHSVRALVRDERGPVDFCPVEWVGVVDGRLRTRKAGRTDRDGAIQFEVDGFSGFLVARPLQRASTVVAVGDGEEVLDIVLSASTRLQLRIAAAASLEADERVLELRDVESGVILALRTARSDGVLVFEHAPRGRPVELIQLSSGTVVWTDVLPPEGEAVLDLGEVVVPEEGGGA